MNFLLKLAAPAILPAARRAATILPKATSAAHSIPAIPRPPKVPRAVSAAHRSFFGGGHHPNVFVPKDFTMADQLAPTIRPNKLLKAASDAFFSELEELIDAGAAPSMLRGKFASADVANLLAEIFKEAASPPPLPLAARKPKLYGGPIADALFEGMSKAPKRGLGFLVDAAKPAAAAAAVKPATAVGKNPLLSALVRRAA